jgi:hypothetical protein
MKEAVFHFSDGSYYHIRPDGVGDTIFGSEAHKQMYAIMERERLIKRNLTFLEKINLILVTSPLYERNRKV